MNYELNSSFPAPLHKRYEVTLDNALLPESLHLEF
jgi:hypothetical protein